MDEVKSRERLLCAYMAGRDGMVKLRMPFDEEQLEALMAQETLPELIEIGRASCRERVSSPV